MLDINVLIDQNVSIYQDVSIDIIVSIDKDILIDEHFPNTKTADFDHTCQYLSNFQNLVKIVRELAGDQTTYEELFDSFNW